MREEPRQVAAHQLRAQRRIVVLLGEGVAAVGVQQALVDVQSVARLGDVGLGHERCAQAVLAGDLLDDVLEHDRRVHHVERLSVTEVDLNLCRPVLDVPRFDHDPGGFEHAA